MSETLSVSSTFSENQDCVGIILAAGMGKRMKTSLPKVAHTALGKPLVLWSVESLLNAGVRNLVVVLSPQQLQVEELIKSFVRTHALPVTVAYQIEPLGTAHAALSGMPEARKLLLQKELSLQKSHVIVGFGDTPAVSGASFAHYLNAHKGIQNGEPNAFTLLAFEPADNAGYGRVLTTPEGQFVAIREEKDCTPAEKKLRLCNSGFLCAQFQDAETLLPQIQNKNAAQEYYLTDLPLLGKQAGKRVGVFTGIAEPELAGVNSQEQLARVVEFLQGRIVRHWQAQGVQFLNPNQVYVEDSVTFESDVIVEPFVYLAGKSHFQKGTRILAFSKIVDGKKGN